MAMHLSKEERQIVEHSKKVGRWVGFAVGFGLSLAAMAILPPLFTALGTWFTATTASGGTISLALGGPAQGFLNLIGGNIGTILLASVGGWIGSGIGANKAEDKAIKKIQNMRETNVELAQAQYMAARGMQPEVAYGQGRAGSMGSRIMAEPDIQNGRGV